MSSSDPVDSRLREALEINPEALDSFVSRLEERIVSGATSSPMDEAPAAKSQLQAARPQAPRPLARRPSAFR